MDTSPLPTEECDSSDIGDLSTIDELTLNYYVVRITSYDKFSYEDIKEFLVAESSICQFVVGRETVPQEHFHCVLGVDIEMDIQEVKDLIRAFIVPLWQTDEGKLPKGFGNKQYNCQLAKLKDEAVSYAVKCKEFYFEGFEEDYIKERLELSFEKKKTCNFKTDYIELCKKFQETNDMDIRDFMIEYVQLKAKYGQSVRIHDAYGYAISNVVKRDPSEAENIVENYLYKV